MNRLSKISALVIAIVMMSSLTCLADGRIFDHWVSPTPHRLGAVVDVEAQYVSLTESIVVTFYSEMEDVEVEIYQDGILYDQSSLSLAEDGDELIFPVFEEGTYQVVVKAQNETIYSESFTVDN